MIKTKTKHIPIIMKKDLNEEEAGQGKRAAAHKLSFKVCLCWRRIFKSRVAEPPDEIKKLFKRYSQGGTMAVEGLERFLMDVQGEEKGEVKELAEAIFDSLKHLNIFQRKGLHLEDFMKYLLGDLNLVIDPSLGVHHDMKAPLAHYFLYTGHNSYLTGNQFNSPSSIEPIIKALKRGVRAIELDLWPSSNAKEVEVRHGGTLTSPVDLQECLHAIKEHAFLASEYPVVITFEDHLNSQLQKKVAQLVTRTFGDVLYRSGSDQLTEFPSPEALKKRVLISTKPPKEYLESQISRQDSGAGEEANKATLQMVGADEHLEEEEEEKDVPEYRELIAIHAAKVKGKGGVSHWLQGDPRRATRLSLTEQELENATTFKGAEIVKFTQRNLLRVYPKSTRLDSSNYNPFIGWMHGAQMVAFNMQGHGKYLWTMQGMFRANGQCGYVKKPDFLLNADEVFNPRNIKDLPVKTILRVKVYLGEGWLQDFHHDHFDRYSPPDFYARVGIAGVPEDQTGMKETRIIEDEWLPIWNQEFEFELRVPELAVVRVEVKEYDTTARPDFGGQTCLPLSELRKGIRVIPLHDKRGDKYKHTRVLMRISFATPYDVY